MPVTAFPLTGIVSTILTMGVAHGFIWIDPEQDRDTLIGLRAGLRETIDQRAGRPVAFVDGMPADEPDLLVRELCYSSRNYKIK